MSDNTIEFLGWIFQPLGDPDVNLQSEISCTCLGCQNYQELLQESQIFPGRVHDFLHRIGVDYRQAHDVYYTNDRKRGYHIYKLWFGIPAKIIEAPAYQGMELGSYFTFYIKPILDQLIRMEVTALLPWVLDQSWQEQSIICVGNVD